MPQQTALTDLQLILLSTAFARDGAHVFPLRASIAERSEDVALAITTLLKRRLVATAPVDDRAHMWKEEDDHRIGLVLTDKARAIIDGTGEEIVEPAPLPADPAMPRAGSKAETVLALLARVDGASPAELIDATGWLPHTMRAALTGLRKKGHAITRGLRGDQSVYRLTHGA